MADNTEAKSGSFTSAMTLSQMGMSNVPECYILPPTQRPTLEHTPYCSTALPVIDLSALENPDLRPQAIKNNQEDDLHGWTSVMRNTVTKNLHFL